MGSFFKKEKPRDDDTPIAFKCNKSYFDFDRNPTMVIPRYLEQLMSMPQSDPAEQIPNFFPHGNIVNTSTHNNVAIGQAAMNLDTDKLYDAFRHNNIAIGCNGHPYANDQIEPTYAHKWWGEEDSTNSDNDSQFASFNSISQLSTPSGPTGPLSILPSVPAPTPEHESTNQNESTNQPESDCIICSESLANNRVALFPCGHAQFCLGCISKLKHQICPICRSPFSASTKIFV